MVRISNVRQQNVQSRNEHHVGAVCVFVGATAGIGAATLARMLQMFDDSTFYVLGRSASKFEQQQHSTLERLNSSNNISFIETEVSLISSIDNASKQIADRENKVDYLYMSAGKVPFEGASYTKEGLELSFALSYYTRVRLVSNLLSRLQQSPHARILSVLNGGNERALVENDLGLDNNWAPRTMVKQSTTMLSLMFERFSQENNDMTFMHAYPGLVRTDIISGMTPLPDAGVLNRMMLAAIRGVVAVLMLIVGIDAEDCGERQAYHLTNDSFTAGRAWRIDDKSEVVSAAGPLERYREGSRMERIWDFTAGVFEKALISGNNSSVH